jgi:hypothetical protein
MLFYPLVRHRAPGSSYKNHEEVTPGMGGVPKRRNYELHLPAEPSAERLDIPVTVRLIGIH